MRTNERNNYERPEQSENTHQQDIKAPQHNIPTEREMEKDNTDYKPGYDHLDIGGGMSTGGHRMHDL